jgi:universal stress protein A
MQTLKTILHPTDFSDLAANAFHAAFALARAHGARLILLYVHPPEETIQGEFGLMPPEPEDSDAEILDKMDGLVPEGSPVQVDSLVARGEPAEAIVQVAKDEHCDVIVMGTHGRKGLARLFHTHVADNVTRDAPCPVLALRSSQTEAVIPAVYVSTKRFPPTPHPSPRLRGEGSGVRGKPSSEFLGIFIV